MCLTHKTHESLTYMLESYMPYTRHMSLLPTCVLHKTHERQDLELFVGRHRDRYVFYA